VVSNPHLLARQVEELYKITPTKEQVDTYVHNHFGIVQSFSMGGI
jgi:hypothetical protein